MGSRSNILENVNLHFCPNPERKTGDGVQWIIMTSMSNMLKSNFLSESFACRPVLELLQFLHKIYSKFWSLSSGFMWFWDRVGLKTANFAQVWWYVSTKSHRFKFISFTDFEIFHWTNRGKFPSLHAHVIFFLIFRVHQIIGFKIDFFFTDACKMM